MKKRISAAALCITVLLSGCSFKREQILLKEPEPEKKVNEAQAIIPQEGLDAVETTTKEPEKTESNIPEEILSGMSLREKVCQMFIVTPESLSGYDNVTIADNIVQQAVNEYPVGGIILFAENLETQEQTKQMISQIQQWAETSNGVGFFVSVDEEGGSIARVADKLGTSSFRDMQYYGAANDYETAYDIGSALGRDLSALGFNLDFAPVSDVDISGESELGSRMFSSEPMVVLNMVTGIVKGLQENGVCATLKHFPGLGAADGDTHLDSYVVIDRDFDELRNSELIPFRGGIKVGADFVMVGHQIISGAEDDLPSDLSYKIVTGLLRNELEFDGIAITDSHMMNTISGVYGAGEAAVMAINAGIDIVLMPADLAEAAQAVCAAVNSGKISEDRINESVLRILEKKYELGLLDIDKAKAHTPYEQRNEITSAQQETYSGEDNYYYEEDDNYYSEDYYNDDYYNDEYYYDDYYYDEYYYDEYYYDNYYDDSYYSDDYYYDDGYYYDDWNY